MRLKKDFFERAPSEVAQELLGKNIIRKTKEGIIVGKIVEVEAYGDASDLASHARFGITNRNEIMFKEAGRLYVYLNYGIFNLTNIICDKAGRAGAVLIRAAEITKGLEIASSNLQSSRFVKANHLLATGPGKFSVAFNIDRKLNSEDIAKSTSVYIEYPKEGESFDIIKATRVGVNYAGHSKHLLWRFYIKNNLYTSHK